MSAHRWKFENLAHGFYPRGMRIIHAPFLLGRMTYIPAREISVRVSKVILH